MKLTLKYPFKAAGVEITQVEITRPITVLDLIVVGGSLDDEDTYFRASANALGIAPKDFDEVDFEDLEVIEEELEKLAEANPEPPQDIVVRRPKGRDVLNVKKDQSAKNLVKVICRLSGKKEEEITCLNSTQFIKLVGQIADFIGRREKR